MALPKEPADFQFCIRFLIAEATEAAKVAKPNIAGAVSSLSLVHCCGSTVPYVCIAVEALCPTCARHACGAPCHVLCRVPCAECPVPHSADPGG